MVLCSLHLINIGVDDFSFLVGTRVEEETNELCVVHGLMLEYRIVTSDIFLHLSLSRQSIALPLNIGVNDFAFVVHKRVEQETN